MAAVPGRISSSESSKMTVAALLSYHGINSDRGLTSTDVDLRQGVYGLNEMTIHEEESLLIKYIGQVTDSP